MTDATHANDGGQPVPTPAPRAPEAGKPVPARAPRAPEAGFSLIEALVALAILAIAAVGLVRTVETHIDSTRAMERRAQAMWVAENRLAELTLALPESRQDQVEQLGRQWRVAVVRTRTSDPAIERARIEVFENAEKSPLATLDGFVAVAGA